MAVPAMSGGPDTGGPPVVLMGETPMLLWTATISRCTLAVTERRLPRGAKETPAGKPASNAGLPVSASSSFPQFDAFIESYYRRLAREIAK